MEQTAAEQESRGKGQRLSSHPRLLCPRGGQEDPKTKPHGERQGVRVCAEGGGVQEVLRRGSACPSVPSASLASRDFGLKVAECSRCSGIFRRHGACGAPGPAASLVAAWEQSCASPAAVLAATGAAAPWSPLPADTSAPTALRGGQRKEGEREHSHRELTLRSGLSQGATRGGQLSLEIYFRESSWCE